MDPVFFADSDALRAWLRENHAAVDVAWAGLYKKATGKPSVTWNELVDELPSGQLHSVRLSETRNNGQLSIFKRSRT